MVTTKDRKDEKKKKRASSSSSSAAEMAKEKHRRSFRTFSFLFFSKVIGGKVEENKGREKKNPLRYPRRRLE